MNWVRLAEEQALSRLASGPRPHSNRRLRIILLAGRREDSHLVADSDAHSISRGKAGVRP